MAEPARQRFTFDDYVSNQTESAVRIFAETADGDVAPKRVIKGAKTGLSFPAGMLVATTGG